MAKKSKQSIVVKPKRLRTGMQYGIQNKFFRGASN